MYNVSWECGDVANYSTCLGLSQASGGAHVAWGAVTADWRMHDGEGGGVRLLPFLSSYV